MHYSSYREDGLAIAHSFSNCLIVRASSIRAYRGPYIWLELCCDGSERPRNQDWSCLSKRGRDDKQVLVSGYVNQEYKN